jgi:hypothetical protein
MTTLTRAVGGVAVLAVGGLLLLGDRGRAGDDKAARDAVLKIADAFEKGDIEAAKKSAAAVAKKIEDLGEVMDLFKPRTKKGIGVGDKAGVATPDGIEDMLRILGRDAPSQSKLQKIGKSLERMAYITAAITQVAHAKPPEKFVGNQTPKVWADSAEGARNMALELAKAAREMSPAAVRKAASLVNTNCNNCHSDFR